MELPCRIRRCHRNLQVWSPNDEWPYILQQMRQNLISQQGSDIGQTAHVAELDHRPAEAVGLATDYGEGRGALHGEGEKDHQRDGAPDGHVMPECSLQTQRLGIRVYSIEGTERADDHFASDDRTQETDADLPVEAER